MRQAGRFLPEYQGLKKKFSMHQLFYEKELIKKITLMPLNRFDLDAAIIFSDILLPLEALGSKIVLEHQKAPQVIRSEQEKEFEIGSCESLFSFLYEAIEDLTAFLSVPLIGFCGGPLTLLTYLFPEKKDNGDFHGIKRWHYQNRAELKMMIDKITIVLIEHLKLQIKAGCQVIQIFDSWAGRFPQELFNEYAFLPLKKIYQALKPLAVPIIYFSRNLGIHQEVLPSLSADAISIDSSINFQKGFSFNKIIQGTFDPALLLTTPSIIKDEILKKAFDIPKNLWIGNLGHGVLPETPIENVHAFIDTIHALPSSTWRQ